MQPLKTAIAALLIATPTLADPLSEMDGSWRGSGWARETPEGPKEAVRCQIRNSYDAATATLKINGKCAVPGRKLDISGTLTANDGAQGITGRWSNPDGLGSVRVRGQQRDDTVAFTYEATNPVTGKTHAQNVEWRVKDSTLRLVSADPEQPGLLMSDILFAP